MTRRCPGTTWPHCAAIGFSQLHERGGEQHVLERGAVVVPTARSSSLARLQYHTYVHVYLSSDEHLDSAGAGSSPTFHPG
jgi:hypothetical protein